jgi:hypothetical protein
MLVGCWRESEWKFERVDGDVRSMGRWSDGVRLRAYPDRLVAQHEAETWVFRDDRILEIVSRSGQRKRARYRLKGRGHMLTLRPSGASGLEVYKLEDLDGDRLVLDYDVGMEVRGIARLTFERVPAEDPVCRGRFTVTTARGSLRGAS